MSDVTHRKRGLRILGIWEKAVSWVPASERQSWDSVLGEARRLCALRAPRVGWVESWRCKSSQHRKIVSLSLLISNNLLLKGNKVSYLNQFGDCRNRLIGLVGRVFANGPGYLGSITGRVIPKTLKMVLDTSLLNTQQYKVGIEGKVEQSRERSSALPYTSV